MDWKNLVGGGILGIIIAIAYIAMIKVLALPVEFGLKYHIAFMIFITAISTAIVIGMVAGESLREMRAS